LILGNEGAGIVEDPAYLTAQITLTQAGFEPGKTVLAPAIGGAVGNAVTQLAPAQGAAQSTSKSI
jgi:NADPH:quinone reductase-like Zn-dependent oxidoreductase